MSSKNTFIVFHKICRQTVKRAHLWFHSYKLHRWSRALVISYLLNICSCMERRIKAVRCLTAVGLLMSVQGWIRATRESWFCGVNNIDTYGKTTQNNSCYDAKQNVHSLEFCEIKWLPLSGNHLELNVQSSQSASIRKLSNREVKFKKQKLFFKGFKHKH